MENTKAATQAKPRQVVFIMTDSQRYDMLGCSGTPGMRTPCLDKLASQGIRFDRAYTCQPVCAPARSSLFLGTWPHTNGVVTNNAPPAENSRNIGQRLSAHGIRAAYIGKWHLDGTDYFGNGKCPPGWDPDYWYDGRRYLDELSPADRVRSRQPETNKQDIDASFTYGHRCSNRAIDFLQKNTASDFFLVVSYDEPHHPYLCPKKYVDLYADYAFPKSPNLFDTLEDKPEHQKVWAKRLFGMDKNALQIKWPDFFGCNTFVDDEIGRVVAAVDQFAPDALIIYTSDHGELLFAHSLMGKGATAYDEAARIPFIVRWPGHAPAGIVSQDPVSHIDIVPTIMAAFGLDTPQTLPGKSMLPTITDPSIRPNDVVFTEFTRYELEAEGFGGYQPMRAAFDGRYKLAINLLSSDELYDVQEDPHEMKNLINSAQHAAIRNQLHDRILQWLADTNDPYRGYCWSRRPWRTDAPAASWGEGGPAARSHRLAEADEPPLLEYFSAAPSNSAPKP